MGSAIALAISTSVFNTYVRPRLGGLLDGAQWDTSLVSGDSLAFLPPQLAEQVKATLAEGYNRQTLVLCISAALQVPASLLMWEKKQLVF